MEIKIVKSNSPGSGCTLTSLAIVRQQILKNQKVAYLSYDSQELGYIQSWMTEDNFKAFGAVDCDYTSLVNSEIDLLVVDLGVTNELDDSLSGIASETIYVHNCSAGFPITSEEVNSGSNTKLLLNKVPEYKNTELEQYLNSSDTNTAGILGVINEDRYLNGLSFAEILEAVKGYVIDGSVDSTPYVERFLIGGNIMDSGEGYFARYDHQAVVTRGGRPDIQMSSIMNGTKCLILTGSVKPTEYIISEARKHSVPMISVEVSTEETIALLSVAFGDKPACAERIDRFVQLLDAN
ncbi:MAG: DRTGG domain-containing protein [Dehalococcoidia bacterium]